MNDQKLSIDEIFHGALQRSTADERERYLDSACEGNAALKARINRLLAAQPELVGFLEAPAPDPAPTAANPNDIVGTMIGPYKLLEQIGEGGMGLVYMAEQQHPVRRLVALKLVKPGMDSKQVIARFEAERQALAMMDHPNIAKVHDAGTTEAGRPYFAMELVRGIPINEFCNQQKLTVRQRLELFIQVCQAIQHAHQKGIIHRDLKPTNVLVAKADTVPLPKVIDFGIAKALGPALTDHTLHTGFSQLVGTPLYMSPEQAEMNHFGVDTRSDVYSLGVLLYELLTGTTPFDKETLRNAGFEEMRRIIREEEPETVSQRLAKTRTENSGVDAGVNRRVHAATELDWIVMKALEKDRSHRYESASALASDIHRYLSDEPVLACPPTMLYRFQKFARKHKAAFSTAAALAACLILGTTVSAWQAVRATTAEAHAEANEKKANANANAAEQKEQEAIKQRDEVKALADKLAAKEQQLQRTLYAAHMNLAHNAFEAGAPARLRDLLAQHRPHPGEPDLRGFEWQYLNRLCRTDLLVLKHTGRVRCVAYSPDGKRLATIAGNAGTSQGTLSVWDAQTGKVLFSQRAESFATVTFSPDGKRVASLDEGDTKIWDSVTGQEIVSLKIRRVGNRVPTRSAAPALPTFSPDGKWLATGSGTGPLTMWDAHTGEWLFALEGHSNQIRGLAFSPDGKRLASASNDKTVKLWDTESRQILRTFEGHTEFVFGVAYSPDGKQLASASVDKTVKLWDAVSGDEIRTMQGHTALVFGVAFSPDGKRVASASEDTTVKVWDVESGGELFTLSGHTRGVWSVAFSPDGTRLASASEDGTLRVREAQPVQKVLALGGGATWVAKVAFSPDGKRLTSVDGRGPGLYSGTAQVWDTQTGERLLTFEAGNNFYVNVALSLDGRRLVSGSSRTEVGNMGGIDANIWSLETGEMLQTFPIVRGTGALFVRNPPGSSLIREFALSPDGKRLCESQGNTVKVWDADTGQELHTLAGHATAVKSVAFSPDGKFLASASVDQDLKLWDTLTGTEIVTINGATSSMAFSSAGNRFAGGSDDETVAKIWNSQTGEHLISLKGHSGTITSVTFSPDDKRLATTSSDATIKVWDSETGQELLTLAGHSGRSNGVAFSPDGHRLAAGGPNGTVLIYDATPLPEKP